MKRARSRWTLLILGMPVLSALLTLGCDSTQRSESAGAVSRVSTQWTEHSTAASDSPRIRWLLRDPDYSQ